MLALTRDEPHAESAFDDNVRPFAMPRYLIERTFPDRIDLPGPGQEVQARLSFIEINTNDGVTWVHSYIAPDRKKSFCIYDSPTPEAVRRAAMHNGLPVDRITEVLVLDPYCYVEG